MNHKILFIVGNSRSGTTMLGRIMGNHTLIHTFGELHFFEQLVDEPTVVNRTEWPESRLYGMLERLFTSSRDGFFSPVIAGRYLEDAKKIVASIDRQDPVSAYQAFLLEETRSNGKLYPCEQTPQYLFSSDEILQAFPESSMINIIRDPRDVLLSQKNKWRRRFLGAKNIPLSEVFRAWMNYHPFIISKLWTSSVCKAKLMEDNDRFISTRFEELLQSPEREIKKICELARIDFEPGMLAVPQIGSSSGVDRPEVKGIDKDRTEAWRKGGLTSVELAICQRVAASEMQRLGYKVEPVTVGSWQIALTMLVFVLKIFFSLLLNLRRSRNIIASIRRRLFVSSKQDS